jgi:phage protein D/phage baseplate assembly protein gpV
MTAVHSVPRVTVTVDGSPLDAAQASALRHVRVVQALSVPAQCELIFQAPDEGLANDGVAPGTSIRVELDDSDTVLFDGEVTATEHVYTTARWLELRVRAHDSLHRLQKRQSARAMTDVDIAAVARELVSDAGISATVEARDAGAEWPLLLQHDQTDFELLRDVCERSGRYFVLRDDTLHLLTLEGIRGDAPKLTLGAELVEATFELNAGPTCRRVVARGWDPSRAAPVEGQADSPRSGRSAGARAAPDDVGGGDERLLGGLTGASDTHAQLIAQAELDRAVASELVVRGTALGNPDLRPGSVIEVAGVADRLAGKYVLTEVVHTIDPETGYQTVMSTQPPPAPSRRDAGTLGIALAKVTSVDDPEGLGRVRVQLPAFGDLETGWIQVLGLGAGAKKGLAILPDTDDQVLISLVHGGLGQAIVLGGLYDGGNPDPGIEGGNTRRFSLQTAGGQRLVFDDKSEILKLVDAKGNYLELSKDRVLLHAEVPLTIEAPGKSLVFRASTIDFERR